MLVESVDKKTVKISFDVSDEHLLVGDVIKIIPESSNYNYGILAQIASVESSYENSTVNIANTNILFTIKQPAKITEWQGNVPSKSYSVEKVAPEELSLYINKAEQVNPVYLGNLSSHKNIDINIESSNFKYPTAIFYGDQSHKINISCLLAQELANNNNKVVIFDFNGEYSDLFGKVLYAGKDFKLPLDSQRIENLYESLSNLPTEARIIIEDIFMNIQDYLESGETNFIPISHFREVISAECQQSEIPELFLLRNKLIKLEKSGIFANTDSEINSFNTSLQENNLLVLDFSKVSQVWHKEFLEYLINLNKTSFFAVLEAQQNYLNDSLLNKISSLKNSLNPVILAEYGSTYTDNLLLKSKNLILFPSKFSSGKFPEFKELLIKLNSNEALIYGKISNNIPLFINPNKVLSEYEEQYAFEALISPKKSNKFEIQEEIPEQQNFEYPEFTEELEELEEFEEFEPQQDQIVEISESMYDDIDSLYTAKKPETKPENFVEDFELESPEQESLSNAPFLSDVPIYSTPDYSNGEESSFEEGNTVKHDKYGIGTINKIISYGNKKLYSIQFQGVGKRLLDPNLTVLELVR